MEFQKFIEEVRQRLNSSLPDFRTVDLGFWNKSGEYEPDYQIVDMRREDGRN